MVDMKHLYVKYGVLIKGKSIGEVFNLLLFVKDCKYKIVVQSAVQLEMGQMCKDIESFDIALKVFQDYSEKLENSNIRPFYVPKTRCYEYKHSKDDILKDFYL